MKKDHDNDCVTSLPASLKLSLSLADLVNVLFFSYVQVTLTYQLYVHICQLVPTNWKL